ncbi:MAG: acyltransferase [Deltaproteobacteria bacterium]|nr:acyltransferase [Deltaproteobacteria bacterium]
MLKGIYIAWWRFVGQIFFDGKYLKGKYFDNSLTGWRWVWRSIFTQKLFGFNRHIPWPVSPNIVILNAKNIQFHVDSIKNFQSFGCYFQNQDARIFLGKGVWIGPNVGIITSNHEPEEPDRHLPGEDIHIGDNCWIGMNAVVLPGVVLGPNTTVGAGSVVNRSYPEGNCVIAGVPARLIRKLDDLE